MARPTQILWVDNRQYTRTSVTKHLPQGNDYPRIKQHFPKSFYLKVNACLRQYFHSLSDQKVSRLLLLR